jgi:hypothetical protein
MGGGASGAPSPSPIQQSPMQVPTAPSAVQAASGGGQLVQPQAQPAVVAPAPAPTTVAADPAAGAQPAPPVAGGGGGAIDLTALVPVLNQVVTALNGLVAALNGAAQVSGGGGVGGGCAAGGCGHTGCQHVAQGAASTETAGANAAPTAPAPAPAPSSLPPKDGASREQIDAFIKEAAAAYGADPEVLSKIAKLESNYRADAVNDWDSNAKKGTPSKGMFQFIEPTFKSYAPKARDAKAGAWEGLGELDWMDWRQQALATAWAITNGHGKAWATYKRAGGS